MARRYHYQETSLFAWWVHLLIWFCALACIVPAVLPILTGGERPLREVGYLIAIGLAIPAFLYLLFGSLRTRVTSEAVEISWGLSGIIRKVVSFSQIESMEPVTYRPIREFGGWGIRFGRGKKQAWTASGNQALVLHLKGGVHLYVGSGHPARLEERIRSAMSIKQPSQ